MDNHTIEVYPVQSNNTKLTISPNRITLKVAEKHFSKYTQEQWEVIVYKMTDVPVVNTHRGMVVFNAFGFVCNVVTENKKSKLSVAYYNELDSVIWKKLE